MLHLTRTFIGALLLLSCAFLMTPGGARAADYIPFQPDTTVFVPPFVGHAVHFVSPSACMELTQGNIDDEVGFLTGFVPDALLGTVVARAQELWQEMWNDPQIPHTALVAALAAGWSYPESLTVTYALVDTSGGCTVYPVTRTFIEPLPEFPNADPADTSAVQQVNMSIQFRGDAPKQLFAGSLGMSVETTDPAGRPAGGSTVDIFDVSDKAKVIDCLPLDLLIQIGNSGTGGVVAYQFQLNSLATLSFIPYALQNAEFELGAQWETLGAAVQQNSQAILGIYPKESSDPCGVEGGMRVFVHHQGTTCDGNEASDCVIFGSGRILGLPPSPEGTPDADAGPDVSVDCVSGDGATVTLDGSTSGDPSGGEITFSWTADPAVTFDDPLSPTPTAFFPVGSTLVTLVVSNGLSQDTDTATVTVGDTTPPEVSVALDRTVLWPANHRLVTIQATVTFSDACGEASCVLTSITSDEADEGSGDGDLPSDIQDAAFGTLDTTFRLRAERDGGGDGRVYTIVYTAEDGAGNTSTAVAEVSVPHSRPGTSRGFAGFNSVGTDFEPGAAEYSIVIPSNTHIDPETIDPSRIDPASVQAGNSFGIVPANWYRLIDLNGDLIDDLEIAFSVGPTREVLSETDEFGSLPVGFHYRDVDGVDYDVPDMFRLGPPLEPTTTGVEEDAAGAVIPRVQPNPATDGSRISYAVTNSHGAPVDIAIYDVGGRRVRSLVKSFLPAGTYDAFWDGKGAHGSEVPAGAYFFRVVVGSRTWSQRVIVAR